MNRYVTRSVAIVLALTACGDKVCTLEPVRFRVNPEAVSIAVGETVTVSGEAVGCGGEYRRSLVVHLTTDDTAFVSIGPTLATVTGRKPGSARVVAGAFTGDSVHQAVSVTVR